MTERKYEKYFLKEPWGIIHPGTPPDAPVYIGLGQEKAVEGWDEPLTQVLRPIYRPYKMIPEGHRHRKPGEHGELEVDLGADVHDLVSQVSVLVRVGGDRRGEQRRPHEWHVEAGRARMAEPQRGQVPLHEKPPVGPAPDLIDLDTRERDRPAVATNLAVIDVVVPKASEEEDGERVVEIPDRETGRADEG